MARPTPPGRPHRWMATEPDPGNRPGNKIPLTARVHRHHRGPSTKSGSDLGKRDHKFRQAQVVFGEVVAAWIGQGFDVIAHGPFFQRHEDDALRHALPDGITPRRVLLHATLDIALERVSVDPRLGLSSDPVFLNATYDRFNELLPMMPPSEWVFDTTTADTHAIVNELAEALLA